MENLFEILFDLIAEGSVEIASDKRVIKFIRYPLIALIILFFSAVIIGLIVLGIIIALQKSVVGGLFILAVGLLLLVLSLINIGGIHIKSKIKNKFNGNEKE